MVPEHPWMHRIRILVLVLGLFCLVTRVPCRAEPLTIMADGILAGASRHLSLAGGEPGRTWTLAFEVPATIAGKGSPPRTGPPGRGRSGHRGGAACKRRLHCARRVLGGFALPP